MLPLLFDGSLFPSISRGVFINHGDLRSVPVIFMPEISIHKGPDHHDSHDKSKGDSSFAFVFGKPFHSMLKEMALIGNRSSERITDSEVKGEGIFEFNIEISVPAGVIWGVKAITEVTPYHHYSNIDAETHTGA